MKALLMKENMEGMMKDGDCVDIASDSTYEESSSDAAKSAIKSERRRNKVGRDDLCLNKTQHEAQLSADSSDTPPSGTEGQEAHPSLFTSGPLRSKGSAKHDSGGCTPCAWYCFSQRGCFKGDSCSFCHLAHKSKTKEKKDSKHSGSEQQGQSGDSGVESTSGGESTSKSHSFTSGDSDTTATTKVTKGRGALRSSRGDDKGNLSSTERRSRRVSFQESVDSWKNHDDHGDGPRLTGIADPINAIEQIKPAPRPTASFAYLPNTATVAIGQNFEAVPLLDAEQPRIFAVAPELPMGLTLGNYTGVIYGVPQQASEAPGGVHFVTSCEPLNGYQLKTAVLRINVLCLPPVIPTGYANNCGHGTAAVPTWMPAPPGL